MPTSHEQWLCGEKFEMIPRAWSQELLDAFVSNKVCLKHLGTNMPRVIDTWSNTYPYPGDFVDSISQEQPHPQHLFEVFCSIKVQYHSNQPQGETMAFPRARDGLSGGSETLQMPHLMMTWKMVSTLLGPCERNPPIISRLPSQMASSAEFDVALLLIWYYQSRIWWSHEGLLFIMGITILVRLCILIE